MTGDLNCKNTIWGSTKTDKLGRDLLETLNNKDLIVFNDLSKTRCDPYSGKEESLDLMIGNCDSNKIFHEFWVGFDVGSDHYPLHLTLKFDAPTSSSQKYMRKIEKMNIKKWESELKANPPLSTATTPSEVDNNAHTLTKQIQDAFENSCPLTKQQKKRKCKFTPEIEKK